MDSETLSERRSHAVRVMERFPDRVPLVLKRGGSVNLIPEIDRPKYMLPKTMTVGQFMHMLRKRIEMHPAVALFFSVDGIMPPTAMMVGDLYARHASDDGFLYVTYTGESTFGSMGSRRPGVVRGNRRAAGSRRRPRW